MTKTLRPLLLLATLCPALLPAQTANTTQQLLTQGLRTTNGHGGFTAAAYAPNGNLLLLDDEGDGVRLLETDAHAATLLAQTQLGAAGDHGVAMTLDPDGNIYIAGTNASGSLSGTADVPFPNATGSSTNSFVAKFNSQLQLVFLSFLGEDSTQATGIAATQDAVFVTGVTFSASLPVTPSAIQQTPANGTTENGFVERFSADGSSLIYATYLTGVGGNTMPAAIAADSSDNAYITGATSASGFPTLAALEPRMLGSTSGFLTKLTPAGDGFTFSTFLAGSGIIGLALDTPTNSLLLTGNVSLGQFPVASVLGPLAATGYQTLVQIPLDGQSVTQSMALLPATASTVSVAPDGSAWISGELTPPLFPAALQPFNTMGNGFLLHVTTSGAIDQTLRTGGLPINNASYASLNNTVPAPAISSDGSTIALPGTITAAISSSLLTSERFDVPFVAAPNNALPDTVRDILPQPSSCATQSQCTGSAGVLSVLTTASAASSLSLSVDDLPQATLRNLGSATADNIAITAAGYSVNTDCTSSLDPGAACSIELTGTGPGTLSASASNAATATASLPSVSSPAIDSLALSARELDFGVLAAEDVSAVQTLTITNLGAAAQTFSITPDGGPAQAASNFSVISTSCGSSGTDGTYLLQPSASCSMALQLAPATSSSSGAVSASYKIGSQDILLTGFLQAAALSVSADEIDFGTQFTGADALRLPRYLFLSNNSNEPVSHTPVALGEDTPFTVEDDCPETIAPHSVCRMTLGYSNANAPAVDSLTLTLDDGLTVLLTGETLAPAGATASVANPNLSVSPANVSFATPVVVTQTSSMTQAITIQNTGASALPLDIASTGDFTLTSQCPASLPGGASCTVLVSFAPSQPGVRQGLLGVTGGSGFTAQLVALSGTGTDLLPANNGVLDLGSTPAGEPLVAWYQMQNPITNLTASVGGSAFGVVLVEDDGSGHGSPPISAFTQTVSASCANCWLGVQFFAGAPGAQNAMLSLTSGSSGNPYQVQVEATALPVSGLLLSPASEDFGTVAVNSTSAPIVSTLANLLPNAASATIESVTATGDFSIVPNTTGGASCTGELASTASCFVEVVFAPTSTGARSGVLTIATDQGTSTATLNGYGAADPGVAFMPAALVFSAQPGSAATQQSIAVKNTGAASISIGTPSSSEPSFTAASTCGTLAPGASCSVAIVFTPGDAFVQAMLSLPVTVSVNGQLQTMTYTVPLSGAYSADEASLLLLPSDVNYGAAADSSVGQARQFSLTNLSAQSMNITLSLPRQFALTSPSPCETLAAGASCTFQVSFLPVTNGSLTGTVLAQGTPTDGSAASEALGYLEGYGTGSGALTISGQPIPNSPVNFGQVASGQSSQQTLTLTNSSASALTVRRITSDPPFVSTTSCGSTLVSGASCTVTISYEPVEEVASGSSSPREDSGTLTIESDAATSPDEVGLTGSTLPITSADPASSAEIASYQLSQSALTFANTQIGNSSTSQTVTLSNTGSAVLHISSVVAPADFTASTSCATLLPGDVCNISVQFAPGMTQENAIRSGTLEIHSDAADSLEFITLLGGSTPAPLSFAPASLDFGTVSVGQSDQLSLSMTNTSASAVTLNAIAASGDYTVQRGACPASGNTLAVGASCTLEVTFAPTAVGTRSGTLSVSSGATQLPLTVALTGQAIAGELQIAPGALAFGIIAEGATAPLTIKLTNTGTATITGISNALSGTNSSDFAVTIPCPAASLAPQESCSETVSFTPSSTSSESATLSIASSDANSPITIPLTGTGVQAGSFTLTVNGGSTAAMSIAHGGTANFMLTATPVSGFTGTVALTCTPVQPGPYANCSILSSTLTLNGSAQSSTATINTIVSTGAGLRWLSFLLLLPLTIFLVRGRQRRWSTLAIVAIAALGCVSLSGCGGGGSLQSGSNLEYTPAGTYQWQVTANSTSGAPVSASVMLTVTVQ